jgi:exosortase
MMSALQNPPASQGFAPAAPQKSARLSGKSIALFAGAIVAGPALLLWHLHGLWNPDGSYAYGWVVPLLAAYLCKCRWDDRPPASAPYRGGAVFLAVVFALVTLPAHWLQEAAPERSVCVWSFALAAVGISLALISLAGGTAWLGWFSFPLAFLLTAVPWPHSLESLVSNSLMRGTAGATVEILCLIGVPAVQAGNLVHIENGVIDIDEACSGIRSLQAMVMISLFLGELFRIQGPKRLVLLVLGVAVTLLANVVRTVILSSLGFGQGMSAVDKYHDTAGFAVLVFSLASTLLLAWWLRPGKAAEPAPARANVASPLGLVLPLRLCAALLVWFAVEEIAVEGWYRWREPKWEGWSWSVQWPEQSKRFSFFEIPKRSRRRSGGGVEGSEWRGLVALLDSLEPGQSTGGSGEGASAGCVSECRGSDHAKGLGGARRVGGRNATTLPRVYLRRGGQDALRFLLPLRRKSRRGKSDGECGIRGHGHVGTCVARPAEDRAAKFGTGHFGLPHGARRAGGFQGAAGATGAGAGSVNRGDSA